MKIFAALAFLFLSAPAFAAVNITISGLISAIIWLVIAGLIYWLCMWLLGQCGVPEPFNKVIRILVALVVFIIVLNVLLGFSGTPMFVLGR